MRKITRYISTTVFLCMLMTLFILLSLDVVFSAIDQLGKVRGGYTSKEALIYIAYTIPRRIYEFIPFVCLIGSLIGLGLLASSSELTIVRAAGISVRRIVWMALRPALLFAFVGVILGEYIAPYTEQTGDARRIMSRDNWVRTTNNMWNREGNDFMYIRAATPNGEIKGLTRYHFDENRQLVFSSYAKEAVFVREGVWEERNVIVSNFEGGSIVKSTEAVREWETPLKPNILGMLIMDPEDMSISNLNYYSNYLKSQNLHPGNYALAFWQKTFQPLATISLVIIALSFVFGPLRSVTMGQRVFTGIVFGIAFQLLQKLVAPASIVFGIAPFVAVLFPIALCLLIGLYLLRRAN
jgi:lipopolysaccharide export system permease protein